VRAIISATLELLAEGVEVVPRILVPMLCTAHELESITALIDKVAYEVCLHSLRIVWSLTSLFLTELLCPRVSRLCIYHRLREPFITTAFAEASA
jgi:hypothetical protein